MSIEIRRALESDAAVMRDIYVEASQWIHSLGIRQWNPQHFVEADILREIEQEHAYLLQRDGETLGMCLLYAQPFPFDRIIWNGMLEDDAAYLHRLAVRRAYAGQGFGQAILDWAAEQTAECGKAYLRLDCMGDNEKLNAFYRRAGFTYRGAHEDTNWKASRYERDVRSLGRSQAGKI